MQESLTLCGCGDAGKNFKQGGLARAVAAHDANDIAFFDLEVQILECPEIIRRGHAVCGFLKHRGVRIRSPELARDLTLDLVNQHLAIDHAEAVFFREIFDSDNGKHGESKKLEGGRMKWNPPTRCATPA